MQPIEFLSRRAAAARRARCGAAGASSPSPARFSRRVIWLAAVLLVLTISGCSVLGVAYNRLPSLVMWRLDSDWDLSAEQQRGLREALRVWHAWHREEQLPALADLLLRWQSLARDVPDAGTVCREADALRALLRAATERTADDLARWMPTLTDAQLAHWRTRMDRADEEWRRDWGQTDVDRGVRLSRLRERLEMFYGRLDEAQRLGLREQLAADGYQPELAWAERQRRQEDWLQTARRLRGMDGDAAVAEVRALWARTWRSPDPALAAYQDARWAAACQWLARWHAQATTAQRGRAATQLAAYERELRALAGNGNARATPR